MKTSPTLIDATIRECLKPKQINVPLGLKQPLLEARKFVLDDGMSGFLAELSHRPYQGKPDKVKIAALEQARMSSRLPHKVTWVELNARAYKQYVLDNWPRSYDATGGPEPANGTVPHVGWLLRQHPSLDTAFYATVVVDVDPVETPVMFPFGMAWSVDDAPLPWPKINLPTTNTHAELLIGETNYVTDKVGFISIPEDRANPELTQHHLRSSLNIIKEFLGELRHIWAFLSTINDVPVLVSEVRATKGFVARGSYKRFVDHTTITLKVPVKITMQTLGKRVLAAAKRRHKVRGHWRLYLRGDQAVLCQHLWNKTEDGKLHCPHCQSWKTWVTEHERGDANLGYVTHDYRVEHDEKSVTGQT